MNLIVLLDLLMFTVKEKVPKSQKKNTSFISSFSGENQASFNFQFESYYSECLVIVSDNTKYGHQE
jgi:hypothetical protein